MSVKIFFCYAHEDEPLLNKMKTHLRPLQREGLIDIWHDRDIRAGTEWEQEINQQLNSAQIILLLVSPDFMDSDYCYGIEMKRALARHERGEARVIPVILRHVYWQGVLGKLQALPEDGKPIMDSGWPNQDEVFFNVAESIRNIVEGLTIKAVSNAPSEEPLQDAPIHFKNMPINLLDSLSRKRLCPACIEEFYPGDCRILSERTREELKPAPRGWFEKHYARLYPEPLFHPKYFNKSPRRECPNCGFLLPSNFEKVEKNLNIVIVGDVGVGKTHYLAVLINELKRLHNVFYIVGQDDTESRYHENYFDLLFKQQRPIPPTQPAREMVHQPLIFELVKRNSSLRPRKVNLILYDGAGEDFVVPERIVSFARYLLYADGIIYLADPLSMHQVVNKLPTSLRPEIQRRNTSDVLLTLLHLFETYHGSDAENRLRLIPVAITVSKSDLLKHLPSIKPSRYLFLIPKESYSSRLDLHEIQWVDKEVRTFLDEFGEHSLVEVAEQFPNMSFFAVSSTGDNLDRQAKFPRIEPLRCLDPALWILFKLGIIDS